MAIELAQAYVQIIPSAKGISDGLNNIFNSNDIKQTSQAGGIAMGNIIANAATQIITSGANAIVGAVKDVVGLAQQAVGNYAEYEQLVGGVETLFKESSDTVVEYAKRAYQTAGISSNEYMTTVTSFSASLLQSLGGDTAEAAKVADRAIIDMSDNANKMGTSMESIQNAYNGFAKQNYTMLDNLKLGYGGTKEEMKRLIADASTMTGAMEKLGVSVKEDDMSFANIVNAISVVQMQLGIAGTTALEASETISGSAGSMKAAWDNLITGIASSNADLSGLIDKLVASIKAALKNVLPIIKTTIMGMGHFVEEAVDVIVNDMIPMIEGELPSFLYAIQYLIKKVIEALPTLAKAISNVMPKIINDITKTIMPLLPDLIVVGIEAISAIIDGFAEALPDMIPVIMDGLTQIILAVNDNLPVFTEAAIKLIGAMNLGFVGSYPKLVEFIPKLFVSLVKSLNTNFEALQRATSRLVDLSFEQGEKYYGEMIKSVVMFVINWKNKYIEGMQLANSQILGVVNSIVSGIKNAFNSVVSQMVSIGQNIVAGIWQGITSKADWLSNQLKGFAKRSVQTIKDSYIIKSPSHIFRDEVGKMLVLGMAEGITQNEGVVTDALTDLKDTTIGSMDADWNVSQNIDTTLHTSSAQMQSQIDGLTTLLNEYLPQLANVQIVMDSGKVVGEIARPMDAALGKLQARSERMAY